MTDVAHVTIHSSQFPEKIRRDLRESLRARRVNHKFHYDSVQQTQRWLALHQRYSPSRLDADCRAIYESSFEAAAAALMSPAVHVLGLGCGGGQKDVRLLTRLKAGGKTIYYTPCDVSTAMVLTARQAVLAVMPQQNCFPFVCDLATTEAEDLRTVLASRPPAVVTFFGMIPNFEPRDILPKLTALVRRKDFLLFSANLAPGSHYAAGLKKVLPQYDNGLTRGWLMSFLFDLGAARRDGELKFSIEAGWAGLKRIVARFHFRRPRRIEVDHEVFNFAAGDALQLFFSYRYTPDRVRKILAEHGLEISGRWIAKSQEEGVFLCRKG